MRTCAHLPQIIDRSSYDKFSEFFTEVCDIFKANVLGKNFKGRTIYLQNPKNNQSIWHILSKEDLISHKRVFDTSRAEKITWISSLLYSADCFICDDYLVWAKKHNGNRIRWFIYCKAEKYVIILEEYGNFVLYLITAFNVTPQKEKEFIKDYNFYMTKGIK